MKNQSKFSNGSAEPLLNYLYTKAFKPAGLKFV
jgi:hypothetical protein